MSDRLAGWSCDAGQSLCWDKHCFNDITILNAERHSEQWSTCSGKEQFTLTSFRSLQNIDATPTSQGCKTALPLNSPYREDSNHHMEIVRGVGRVSRGEVSMTGSGCGRAQQCGSPMHPALPDIWIAPKWSGSGHGEVWPGNAWGRCRHTPGARVKNGPGNSDNTVMQS